MAQVLKIGESARRSLPMDGADTRCRARARWTVGIVQTQNPAQVLAE